MYYYCTYVITYLCYLCIVLSVGIVIGERSTSLSFVIQFEILTAFSNLLSYDLLDKHYYYCDSL